MVERPKEHKINDECIVGPTFQQGVFNVVDGVNSETFCLLRSRGLGLLSFPWIIPLICSL